MVTIGELLQARSDAWRLKLIAGASGLSNGVTIPRIQKPGLALAGYLPQIHPERVQVIGRTELGYLATLGEPTARNAVDRMLRERVACVIVTNGANPPAYFEEFAARHEVPLITTELKSSELIRNVFTAVNDVAAYAWIPAITLASDGLTVLAIGASRGERIVGHKDAAQPDRGSDLSLALGLGLLA